MSSAPNTLTNRKFLFSDLSYKKQKPEGLQSQSSQDLKGGAVRSLQTLPLAGPGCIKWDFKATSLAVWAISTVFPQPSLL